MAVDVAGAAMAHGRGRGWGGAELCGRGGAVGGGGAGNLRSAGDARQPHGHERGRKGAAGRASVRDLFLFFIFHVGPTLLFTYHKRIHPFGWITWLDYFRATVDDALTKKKISTAVK